MMSKFFPSARRGYYWESLQKIKNTIERLSLDISANDERDFEDRIAGALQPQFKDFIDQRNKQQVMTRVTLFGHDHRPDMSIDTNGIAVEVKIAKGGQSFKDAIGQAFIYRMGYRFVIVVWIDRTKEKIYRKSMQKPNSNETKFIKMLEENNVFCIVK